MEKLFCLGVVIGMVGGALLVANSYKARSLVKKSQAEILDKMDEMMGEEKRRRAKRSKKFLREGRAGELVRLFQMQWKRLPFSRGCAILFVWNS